MPNKGWNTVAVRDEYHIQLKEQADEQHRSVSQFLELQLIEKGIIKRLVVQEAKRK